MAGEDNLDLEKGEDSRNYNSHNMSWGWRFGNLTTTSMGSIPPENPISIYRDDLMESSSCSPASLLESFHPSVSDQPMITSHNLSFCDVNVKNNTIPFNEHAVKRTFSTGWTPPSSLLRGNVPLLSSSGMLPQSLSQFPTDLGFIERAARFSSFNGGTFGDTANSFSIPGSMSQCTREVEPIQGPPDIFSCVRLSSVYGEQSREFEANMVEGSKDVSMSQNEGNQGWCESGNDSVEAEFSSGGGQAGPWQLEGTDRGAFTKGHGSKKRKKVDQGSELDQAKGAAIPIEAKKHDSETQKKGDQKTASTANKPSGKDIKLGSDSVKQEYIHIRARRGQATNSHSLAERVRREKISERMKFLQDLVPGCSKVTGKAVMLDEIINYVQSLQQQVEFLSMKLASVNPRLDFNVEGISPKDILQPQVGPSSGPGFPSAISVHYPPLHLSQPGTVQAGVVDMGTSSDAFRRSIVSSMAAMSAGNRDSTCQVPDIWEDELHAQTTFNPNEPMNGQDYDGPTRPGDLKDGP